MHTGQQQPLNNMNLTMFQHSKPDKYTIQPCLKSLTVDELNVMVTFSRLALQWDAARKMKTIINA